MNPASRAHGVLLALIIGACVALWAGLRSAEDRQIEVHVEEQAAAAASLLKQRLEHKERALDRLASRWAFSGGTPRDQWEADVRNYLEHGPEYQAIEWVDSSYRVRWVIPYEGNEAARDLDPSFEASRRAAIDDARVLRRRTVTPPVDLVQGGQGFLLLAPIYFSSVTRGDAPRDPDGFGGFIVGVFRFDPLIEALPIPDGLVVSVFDGETRVHGEASAARHSQFTGCANTASYGRVWQIELEPTAAYIAASRSWLPVWLASGAMVLGVVVLSLFNLTRALRTTSERAESERDRANVAAESKSTFVATVSHEIRTPMNGVVATAELLEQTNLDDEQRELVDMLKESSDSLLSIINDVLDFSKLEAHRVEIEPAPHDPRDLLDHVSRVLSPQVDAKGIAFRVEGPGDLPLLLRIDALRVGQVLLNLVGNAIKFTERGHVVVRSRYDEERVVLAFDIEDTGVGIADASNIFEEFTQADSGTTRRFGGSGLGLAISKRLCDLMDGSISVESTLGAGSTFRFEFPAERCAEEENDGDLPEAADFVPPAETRVLVVDDNQVNRMVAEKILRRIGCEVDTARDGAEAVEAAASRDYALILMDCRMPNMDGYEATLAIRADEIAEASERVPIVAMTANTQAEDRRRCLDAGMDDFMSKPVTLEMLRKALVCWTLKSESG